MKLQGPLVLQISGFCDVSGPIKYKVGTSSSKDRIMMIRLTDGVRECKAIEHCRRLPMLNPKHLLPGMKVRVQGLAVRFGVVLLEEKGFEILGGNVSNLVDAYEAQQLYGGPGRDAQQNKEDKPPIFKPFDLTRGRRKGKASDIRKKAEPPRGTKSADESKDHAPGRQTLDVQKEPSAKIKTAAAQSLLHRMENRSGERSRGRGRRHRGAGDHQREDASMTMDEWNARQAAKAAGDSDHALALAMQEQFDLEERQQGGAQELSADILGALYAHADGSESGQHHAGRGRGHRGRGKGRGRGRSRGGRGRGRGRSRQ